MSFNGHKMDMLGRSGAYKYNQLDKGFMRYIVV